MNVSPEGKGNIKVNGTAPPHYPITYSFASGANIRLDALPDSGYDFTHWSGSLTGSNNPAYITMTCSKSITANFASASIGDFVWEDADADGIQDVDEPGIDGVTVNLYSPNDVLAGTTTTSNGGNYIFTGLEPGNYYLEFIAPAGYIFSPSDQGGDNTIDSDADTAGQTELITLSLTEEDLTWDAGMYPVGAYEFDIPLFAGWNLIGLPLIPDSVNIEDVLAGINVEGVATYDGSTQTWQLYNPGAPSDLTEMTTGIGYWVKVNTPCTLTINCIVPSLPYDIPLFSGWNLIGLPLIPEAQSIQEVLDDINIDGAAAYDGAAQTWYLYTPDAPSDLIEMTNGNGYWVNASNACTISIEQIIKNITPAEAYTLIQDNVDNPNFTIIDVRTPEEYASGHIENALNMDYYSATFLNQLDNLKKQNKFLIYCRSGGRSGMTLDMMRELGFREVYNMLGGINQWQAEGYPIVE
ncbi:SdrD B-like domain-containing protein [Chloroflexota bacterium]